MSTQLAVRKALRPGGALFFCFYRLAVYLELTKPRVTFLVLATTAAGFYLASPSPPDLSLLLHTVLATGLLAGGTAVLNQFLEREADGKMRRTWGRPLPSGRLEAHQAMWFGVILVSLGTLYLWLAVNYLTTFLGVLTTTLYLFVYTPLKSKTSLCTLVGAIPGAVPPVLGCTAVEGRFGSLAVILFAILFVWQFPHFLAISWIYREDYEQGGLVMLPSNDPEGQKTGREIAVASLILVPVSCLPFLAGVAGSFYLFGAFFLGLTLLWVGLDTAVSYSDLAARRLLKTSVVYLPLLLILMIFDKA